jgi:hypothetical protein
MNQAATAQFRLSSFIMRGRWLTCILPPVAVIAVEETPGISGLDGINAAGLIWLSPLVVVLGFGLTAAIVALTRWIGRKVAIRPRWGAPFLMLVIVGLLSPLAYLDRDWLLLGVIEMASLPAALLLASTPVPKCDDS